MAKLFGLGFNALTKYIFQLGLLALLYYVAGHLGFSLADINKNVTLVWPPTGIALSALLLLGHRLWPGVLLGAFLLNFYNGLPGYVALLLAIGNTLEALTATYLTKRFVIKEYLLYQTKNVFIFVLFAALVSCSLSATIGVTSLSLTGFAQWQYFSLTWLTWWLGDMVGAIVIAPFFLVWCRKSIYRWKRQNFLEAVLLMGTLIPISYFIFGEQFPFGKYNYSLVYLLIPILLLGTLRLGDKAAVTTTLLLSAFAIWRTVQGVGPFVANNLNTSLFLLQTFVFVVTVMNLALAAMLNTQKRFEQDIIFNQAQTQTVLDCALDGVIMMDVQGCITFWNPQATVIFGWTEAEVMGKKMSETIIPLQYRQAHEKGIRQFLATGMGRVLNKRVELTGLHKDGHEFPIELSVLPMQIGNQYFFGSFLRDISEQRRLQKLKDTIISKASHELRTPLSIIKGTVEDLKEGRVGALSEEQSEVMVMLTRNIERLIRTINDLLDLSRLESGKVKMKRMALNVNRLLQEILDNFEVIVQKRNLQLVSELPPVLPILYADEDMLVQVLNNLLSNAVQYASSKILVKVELIADYAKIKHLLESHIGMDNPGYRGFITFIQFTVFNDGQGIPKEDQERIFYKFERGKNAKRDFEFKGSGLGLAICREIIEQHDGKIWVDSRTGEGAKFHFILPVG